MISSMAQGVTELPLGVQIAAAVVSLLVLAIIALSGPDYSDHND